MNQKTSKPQPQNASKKRLGEEMLDTGLINPDQLQQVLKRQAQAGGHLGSILIEMGFIAIDDLLDLLSRKFGVPGVNLYTKNISRDVISMIPMEKIAEKKVLPVHSDKTTLTLAMVNPQDFATIGEIEFSLGKKVVPMVTPYFMFDAALKALASNPGGGIIGETLSELVQLEKGENSGLLMPLLAYLAKTGANDMLLTAGAPPSIKIGNTLKRLAIPALTPKDCESYAKELLTEPDWETFSKENDFSFSATYPGIGRFRATLYRQRHSIAIALRPIMDQMPSLKELNLPEWINGFALRPQGLILVSGPSGHGKTTTLSAIVDIINRNRGCNIITLEDPVEYLHKHKKSNINQRDIGVDAASFVKGMRHVLRQAPDVIVVGEMRDRETFRIALQAANSGHLVLSTVHSDNSTTIIERIVNMFEPYEQTLIRSMVADCLLLSLSQRLIPLKNGKGRVLALEKFINSARMKSFIRDGKTHQIRTQMQTGSDDFTSIDMALADLYKRRKIYFEDGLLHTEDEGYYRDLTGIQS